MKHFNLLSLPCILALALSTAPVGAAEMSKVKKRAPASAVMVPKGSGVLSGVEGVVYLNNSPAKNGDKVEVGSFVTTGTDGRASVLVGDGMVSIIGYLSQIRLEKFDLVPGQPETVLFELIKGNVRYLVSDRGSKRVAMIRSGDAIASTTSGEAKFSCAGTCAPRNPAQASGKGG